MVNSDLSKLVKQVEVERALVSAGIAVDNGLGLSGDEDVQNVTSNSDEKTIVYSMLDGEPREILRLDARRALNKRMRGGKPAFWIPEMGGEAPVRYRNEIMCYLDPDFDESENFEGVDRAWVDKAGLRGRTCNMGAPDRNNQKFASEYDRDEHMRVKHKREWATITTQKARDRSEREARETRENREAMLALATRSAKA